MCFPFVFCHVLKTIPIIVFWRNFLQVKVCFFSGLCFPFVNITSQYDHSPALFPKNTGRITLLRVIHSLANCFDQVSDISPESIYGIYILWHSIYVLSGSIWHLFYSGILPGIYSDILSDSLSRILSGICHMFWHSVWPSMVFGSRRGPQHPELAMWCSGPGVPSCIRSWQRRSRQQRGGGGGEGE